MLPTGPSDAVRPGGWPSPWKTALAASVAAMAIAYDAEVGAVLLVLGLLWRQAAGQPTAEAPLIVIAALLELWLQGDMDHRWPVVTTLSGPPLALATLAVQGFLLGNRTLGALGAAGATLFLAVLGVTNGDPGESLVAPGFEAAASLATLVLLALSVAAVARLAPRLPRRADVLVVAGLALALGYTLPSRPWVGGLEVTLPVTAGRTDGGQVFLEANAMIDAARAAHLPGGESWIEGDYLVIFEPGAPGQASRPVRLASRSYTSLKPGQVPVPVHSCCAYSRLARTDFPAPKPPVWGKVLATLRVYADGRQELVALKKAG